MGMFFSNLLTVSEQVFILFLLMLIGFVCGKTKLFNDDCVKIIADFCLKFATPSVIIKSFIRSFDKDMAAGLLIAILMAVFCHLVAIAVSSLVFRDKQKPNTVLFRNTAIFSNAGFMGIPLQAALLGNDGTFYGTAYVITLTLFLWTYSYSTMSMGQVKMNLKKILINPGVIGVIIGVPLFVFSVQLPQVVTTTINHVANLNTPLPMIVVGYYISNIDFKTMFKNAKQYLAMGLKLVGIPLICLGLLRIMGFSGIKLVTTIIAVSAPGAVAITMFAAKFDGDTKASAKMVAVSTLFSIVTMPLVVALAQTIA